MSINTFKRQATPVPTSCQTAANGAPNGCYLPDPALFAASWHESWAWSQPIGGVPACLAGAGSLPGLESSTFYAPSQVVATSKMDCAQPHTRVRTTNGAPTTTMPLARKSNRQARRLKGVSWALGLHFAVFGSMLAGATEFGRRRTSMTITRCLIKRLSFEALRPRLRTRCRSNDSREEAQQRGMSDVISTF